MHTCILRGDVDYTSSNKMITGISAQDWLQVLYRESSRTLSFLYTSRHLIMFPLTSR